MNISIRIVEPHFSQHPNIGWICWEEHLQKTTKKNIRNMGEVDYVVYSLQCCVLFQKMLSADQHFQKFCPGTPSVSNRLDPDQAQNFVEPDPSPSCLQSL